ncbi:MAG: bifunctional 4-hydroxy-2-oxoglutarate aldolase/2-dehydro-3-deoxy-phosphogluconate aldolase, partial [Acidimicrobiia bacterium]|nr:bifunctional 4-hydroxy-2-oxoglutarate aldolase/2-dehydro-3-deoxy-phosphogluconate aldolase [Acidimicrobiia bacterium]
MKRPNGPIAAMVDTGFVPVFHHEHAETACAIVDALVAGGASVIEFTDRSEGARSVFDRVVEHVGAHHPNVWLG